MEFVFGIILVWCDHKNRNHANHQSTNSMKIDNNSLNRMVIYSEVTNSSLKKHNASGNWYLIIEKIHSNDKITKRRSINVGELCRDLTTHFWLKLTFPLSLIAFFMIKSVLIFLNFICLWWNGKRLMWALLMLICPTNLLCVTSSTGYHQVTGSRKLQCKQNLFKNNYNNNDNIIIICKNE